MNKACPKCGTVSDVQDSPLAACPSCGAIYAKAAAPRIPAKAVPEAKTGGFMRTLERLLWLATGLGALFGALQIALTSANATSAPQQAAGMAMAVAYAVVPYVLARALQEMRR